VLQDGHGTPGPAQAPCGHVRSEWTSHIQPVSPQRMHVIENGNALPFCDALYGLTVVCICV